MILADTSVWIEHFRHGEESLADRLREGLVLMHPFIIGELACGNLQRRISTLSYLQALPAAIPASNQEALRLLNARRLWGRGLGWVDAHLLASALLSGCRFWTIDAKLAKAARELGLT